MAAGLKKITVDTDVLIDVLTSKRIPGDRRQISITFIKEIVEFGDYIEYIQRKRNIYILIPKKSIKSAGEGI